MASPVDPRNRRVQATVLAAMLLVSVAAVDPSATTARAASAPPQVTLTATVRELGTLGGVRSSAADMDGNLVVGTSMTTDGSEHAFAYDRSTSTMRDLGTLGGASSSGVAVDGSVVVGNSKTATGETHAFAYDLAAVTPSMRDLGTLGGDTSEAVDVDGGVVAGSSVTPGGYGLHAFAYDLTAVSPLSMRDLGDLRGFDFTSAAAIDGTVVVGKAGNSAGGEEHAFSYDLTSGTGMRDLGTLGFDFSQAIDIDGALVVGNSLTSTYRHGDDGQHAFAYDLAKMSPRIRDLGDLGYNWSRASVVAGMRVVGISRRSPTGALHAFGYDLAGTAPRIRDLGNLGGGSIQPGALAGNVLVGVAGRAGDNQGRVFAYDFGAAIPAMTDLGPLGGAAGGVVAVRGDTVAGTIVNAAGTARAALWTIRRTTATAFRFSSFHYLKREDVHRAVITVQRAGNPRSAAAVRYATRDVTAKAGRDFKATSGLLRFAAGQTRTTFTVPILDDSTREKAETALLTLRSPSTGAVLGTPNAAALDIRASDQRPDAWISTLPTAGYTGNNVFNTTGHRQTKSQAARRLQTRSFYVRVHNDGNATNTFTVRGSRVRTASVRYDTGRPDYPTWTRNITRAMGSTTGWRVTIGPNRYQRIRVQITPRRTAVLGSRQAASITTTWHGDITRSDQVKATLNTVR